MANEILQKYGTALTWTSSGGDAAITLTSLANASARQGASLDLGATRARKYEVWVQIDPNVAPTDGATIDFYFMGSSDNALWAGDDTAPSDAAYTTTDLLRNMIHVGALICDNTTSLQVQRFIVEDLPRYVAPVVFNNCGQALTATGTDQIIKLYPIKDEIQ